MNRLFSVVVPILNEREHILPLLESIPNQTFRPVEVVIVDGGSIDGTVSQLASVIGRHPATSQVHINGAIGDALPVEGFNKLSCGCSHSFPLLFILEKFDNSLNEAALLTWLYKEPVFSIPHKA